VIEQHVEFSRYNNNDPSGAGTRSRRRPQQQQQRPPKKEGARAADAFDRVGDGFVPLFRPVSLVQTISKTDGTMTPSSTSKNDIEFYKKTSTGAVAKTGNSTHSDPSTVGINNKDGNGSPAGAAPGSSSTSTSTAVTNNSSKPYTLVCQLSGELGNQLSHLAHCHAVRLWLDRIQHEQGVPPAQRVSVEMQVRHQKHTSKWKRARDDLQLCFPSTRTYNFNGAPNTKYFQRRQKEQIEWLGTVAPFNGINFRQKPKSVESGLQDFIRRTKSVPYDGDEQYITMPFLYAEEMVMVDAFVDKFYGDIKQYLRFDLSSKDCCKLKPYPDESVFVREPFFCL